MMAPARGGVGPATAALLREWSGCCEWCWPNPAASVPGSNARSRSSSARWRNTGRRSMSGTRSCITAMSSSDCAPRARSSSTRSTRSRRVRLRSLAPMGSRARSSGVPVIDATCPLVSKVHIEGQRYANQGREIILIGHAGHPEIEGTMGRITGRVHLISRPEEVAALSVADPDKLAFITQTTLSVDDTRAVIEALKARFPSIVGPDTKDICYATQNRQRAARELARIVDVVLV